MRRQRTASESNEDENNNDNSINNDNPNEMTSGNAFSRRRSSVDEDMNDESANDRDSHESDEEETDNDDESDNEEDDEEEEGDDYDEDDEYDGSSDVDNVHFDIMEQLQSALFGAAGVNQEDMDRIRRTLSQHQQGLFASIRGGATHSNRVASIIRALPTDPQTTDPMLLYSAFTELWELIVLTGEEVEAYEFDMVLDLKPLLGHLLRVIKWDPECQVYGTEFLLYAVRCTRACIQYSPNYARRLVELGLVPLISQQLFSVEYIDLAEDLVQIILLLSKSGTHSKACLHSDGIRAVLGFVDFFALSVQVNAFNAAAQMAVALTGETLHLYLPDDILALLRSTVRRIDTTSNGSDQQVLKLSHWALQTLFNASQSAPKHVDTLFPVDFVIETVSNLATVHPLDISQIILSLVSISEIIRASLLKNDQLVLNLLKTLLGKAVINENLSENCLRIVIELYCKSAHKPLLELLPICIKDYKSAICNAFMISTDSIELLSQVIHEFYSNSSSIPQSQRQLTLLTLLLLDDVNPKKSVTLVKTGTISRLLCDLKSPLTLIIGLEWCRVLSNGNEAGTGEFVTTATRQGLLAELESLTKFNSNLSLNEQLKKWFSARLESMNVTIFSGDETETLCIYIKHVSNDLINHLNNTTKSSTLASSQLKSIQDFINNLDHEQFTEFEWLGDSNTCLSRVLLNLLQNDPEEVKKIDEKGLDLIIQSVYKALNRYETVFTTNLPSINLPRLTNSMDSLALLSRPMRVLLQLPDATQKMVVCDPFSNISWLVKMAIAGDEERKIILKETTSSGNRENVTERIYDAITESTGPNVNFSSMAFETADFKKAIYLSHKNNKFPLEPSASLIEVLFKYVIKDSNNEPWKKINEIWSSNVTILIEERNCDETMDTELVDNNEQFEDERVKLALNLLNLLPKKLSNDQISSKLSKELDSPLLVAVNGISSHWIQTAQTYPFLLPFNQRVSLMKTVCSGRLRSLWLLQQRLTPVSGDLINDMITSTISLPRKRFRIHRSQFLKCLGHVFTPVNCGDLRLFEYEYNDELGTGHGPTMEFYALASTEICRPSLGLFHVTRPSNLESDEMIEAEGEGLFPSWTSSIMKSEEFRILGALIARAWLDDRIIDIPLHPLLISSIRCDSKDSLVFEDLKRIDPDLYKILIDESKMIECGISFNVPGTEISLLTCDRAISTSNDLKEFHNLLICRINAYLIQARDSFLQGFNETFPQRFDKVASFFPGEELSYLFTPSLLAESDWTLEAITKALVPDHGYRSDSPQIRWLAELLVESGREPRKRSKMIRFLTGAAYLPVGGWKSLRPPLTIVCKTFETVSPSRSTSMSESSTTETPSTLSPAVSVSAVENHDSYLPSVMTCANYLKLPRYTSKEIMRERLGYAIEEGSGSFHLS